MADAERYIDIRGAAEHNLKNLDIRIPREKLIVVTGLSGSGKSSLAFDIIYAEGQRRYVESLSSYARQFLEQLEKPDVEHVAGLPPTIAIDQRTLIANPRSTVATTTEIYDYLRLLFARVGQPFCHVCGLAIARQSPEEIVNRTLLLAEGTKIMVIAPLVRGQRGAHRDVFEKVRREGFVRVRVDGDILELDQVGELAPRRAHTIEAVVDRLIVRPSSRSRLHDSIEVALGLSEGLVVISHSESGPWQDSVFSEVYACHQCGHSLAEVSPRTFSFNSPYGACPTCSGLGTRMELDPDLVVSDPEQSLAEGAVEAWRAGVGPEYRKRLTRFGRDFEVDLDVRFCELPPVKREILLRGTSPATEKKFGTQFSGVLADLAKRFGATTSDAVKQQILEYMGELPCPDCKGGRLRPESLAVKVNGRSISEVAAQTVAGALDFFRGLALEPEAEQIAEPIVQEVTQRLQCMADLGLSYLTLGRGSATLAGGEAQRIRLATQVGSALVGVCYVLDEPTIGLHQRDTGRLIETLRHLQQIGNTVIVVDHDEQTIRSADHLIDLGPGAGAEGGRVVAQGDLRRIVETPGSVTGAFLGGRRAIAVPPERRPAARAHWLEVRGAQENNLKNIDVKFPLGTFCCVTGVSGSGKSTLVSLILHRALARKLNRAKVKPGAHQEVVGSDQLDKVVAIDQAPIGRSPRSNPATYTKVFAKVRELFAQVKAARIRGYRPGRFSFNVKGGRCEACEGQGTKKIEMHFLPDVYVVCQECKGKRFNRETLEIRFKGLSISDVLDLRVDEALELFSNFRGIRRILQTLKDVGLGYLALGQSSTTLSGGEAQRVRLAAELGRPSTGRTFYILDEPTTGLHFADIEKLLVVLSRLVDKGNTVLVIEHNLDVIKCADYIVDLGPEGGDDGGGVVVAGPPERVAQEARSYTGAYLRPHLNLAG